ASSPDHHVVIAASRGPDSATSRALHDLSQGEDSRLVLVKLDSAVEADATAAVQLLAAGAGRDLRRWTRWWRMRVKAANLQRHFTANVLGFVWLYQAVLPLLRRSLIAKWKPTSPSNGVYGPSKAMVYWYTKRMNAAEETITAFVVDPGWSNTDMGIYSAGLSGLSRAPYQPDDSCDGIMRIVDTATIETRRDVCSLQGGHFALVGRPLRHGHSVATMLEVVVRRRSPAHASTYET
ncbi:hypothetical protein PG985_000488, partial [Apiospora marii]